MGRVLYVTKNRIMQAKIFLDMTVSEPTQYFLVPIKISIFITYLFNY